MRAAILLIAVLASGCMPKPEPTLAVDACALKEYLQDCEDELTTPDEQTACKKSAPLQATRVRAGIPPECRGPSTH